MRCLQKSQRRQEQARRVDKQRGRKTVKVGDARQAKKQGCGGNVMFRNLAGGAHAYSES